jgi:branched-chain amino acid transport system permease protein
VLTGPGGLASVRTDTAKGWWRDIKALYEEKRYEWSGDKARDKRRERERRLV